jgi:hypothetical protein
MDLEAGGLEPSRTSAGVMRLVTAAAGTAGSAAAAAGAVVSTNLSLAAKEVNEQARIALINKIEARLDAETEKFKLGATDDPYMPSCLRRRIRSVLDVVAADVRLERSEFLDRALGSAADRPAVHTTESINKPNCIVAFILYHKYPFDKSIWQMLRDPFWLLMNLLKAIPFSGIQPACFALLLLFIDRRDEFQLVQFVLSFKAVQFFTSGVIASLVGAASYFNCITLQPIQHTCAENGPGASSNLYVDAAGFAIMVVLSWVAMFLMRTAVPKGGA